MCRYRIVQDGLPLLLPYVTRQLLQPTVQELLHLIEDRSLYVPEEARAAPAAAPAPEQAADQVMREATAATHAAGPADGQADAAVKEEAVEKPDVKAEDGQAHVEGIGHTVPWHH